MYYVSIIFKVICINSNLNISCKDTFILHLCCLQLPLQLHNTLFKIIIHINGNRECIFQIRCTLPQYQCFFFWNNLSEPATSENPNIMLSETIWLNKERTWMKCAGIIKWINFTRYHFWANKCIVVNTKHKTLQRITSASVPSTPKSDNLIQV